MPKLKIGDKTYHLVFRIIVRAELRMQNEAHTPLLDGEAICRPGDAFQLVRGKKLALKELIRKARNVRGFPMLDDKMERRRIWSDFLFSLSGKKRPKPKVKSHSVENPVPFWKIGFPGEHVAIVPLQDPEA